MQIESFSLLIDGKKVDYQPGQTILEVASRAGIEIPHLCYHPGVSSKGFAHICFVMIKGREKLEHACSWLAETGIEVITKSQMIEKVRKQALTLLISDHPAECPICIRAGECELQDLAFFHGEKEASLSSIPSDKSLVRSFSPVIEGHMSRCIGCGRCISFLEDVAGTAELGLFSGKNGFTIDCCWEEGITSEISGNLLDLCPSGALVEKTSFKGRRTDSYKIPSLDVMDAMGSSIYLECKGGKVLRVLPRINPDINQYWTTDKVRFSCDGLLHQRLEQPYARRNGILEPVSWIEAFKLLVRKIVDLKPSEMAFLVGDLVEADSVYLLRQLLDEMKIYNRDCRVDRNFLPTEERSDYLFNTTFQKISESDACLIIGSDIRHDAPLLNIRLRDCYKGAGEKLALWGNAQDLTFSHTYLGSSTDTLNKLAEGAHPFCKQLEKAKNPIVVVGSEALTGERGESIYSTVRFIAQKYKMVRADWNGFNVLHHAAGRVGSLDVGFVPKEDGQGFAGILRMGKLGQLKLLYLMGVDEVSFQGLKDTFIVYQGHHGDTGVEHADLVLPGAAFSEKNGFYVNTEGKVQFVQQAVLPPGEAKEDWKIIRGLSEVLGYKLPYETYEDVYLGVRNHLSFGCGKNTFDPQTFREKYGYNPLPESRGMNNKKSYYFTNPICRASPTMAQRGHVTNTKRIRDRK